MAVNFPDSPSVNDTFTSGTRTYKYDGTSWRLFSSTVALPSADLIPPGNEEQDLGSPTNRYKDLYLSSNSLHLGDTIVSTTAEGTLQTEISGQVVDVGGGGGVETVATADDFPLSPTAGDQVFVTDTGSIYLYTGSSWSRIAVLSEAPTLTGIEDSYALNSSGTATTITVTSTDAESDGLTFDYRILSNSTNAIDSVSNTNNVFTITPSTVQSNAGSATVLFRVNDGSNYTTRSAQFDLSFARAFADPTSVNTAYTTFGPTYNTTTYTSSYHAGGLDGDHENKVLFYLLGNVLYAYDYSDIDNITQLSSLSLSTTALGSGGGVFKYIKETQLIILSRVIADDYAVVDASDPSNMSILVTSATTGSGYRPTLPDWTDRMVQGTGVYTGSTVVHGVSGVTPAGLEAFYLDGTSGAFTNSNYFVISQFDDVRSFVRHPTDDGIYYWFASDDSIVYKYEDADITSGGVGTVTTVLNTGNTNGKLAVDYTNNLIWFVGIGSSITQLDLYVMDPNVSDSTFTLVQQNIWSTTWHAQYPFYILDDYMYIFNANTIKVLEIASSSSVNAVAEISTGVTIGNDTSYTAPCVNRFSYFGGSEMFIMAEDQPIIVLK